MFAVKNHPPEVISIVTQSNNITIYTILYFFSWY